ncbi:hypothetical protein CLOP_g2734 [Closterium sp. NIES-67]|nr:hypothetical protein CLOP_g2734 [Closterium sp. NIES-67]
MASRENHPLPSLLREHSARRASQSRAYPHRARCGRFQRRGDSRATCVPLLVLLVSLPTTLLRPTTASPPDVSALYTVRLRSAPSVASYRGGLAGYPATAVWDSDPNANATDASSDDAANSAPAPSSSSSSSSSALSSGGGVGIASVASVTAAAAAATNGLGRLGRLIRRPRLNVKAPAVRAFKQLLQRMQQAVVQDSGVDAGKVVYSFKHASNGFSATLTPAQVQRMKRHPSVASVTRARVVRPATTDSYKFLGLPDSLWAAAGSPSDAGDGMVVGIVDTGVWPEHPSFDDTGFSSTLPSGWSGTCPTTNDFTCNNKIIGGGVFHDGFESGSTTVDLSSDWMSPRDAAGHGTWCASASAGNNGITIPNKGSASGMAPGARLAIYKVFWQSGGSMYATSPDIVAAVDQAVADGVDVLSLSLGGASPYDTYFDDVPFISVNAAGVFVAFAAGNEGRPSAFAATGYRTLCNFSPYYMTVGASTIVRGGASLTSKSTAAAALESPTNSTAPTTTTTSPSSSSASTVSTLSGARIPAAISPSTSSAPVVAYFSSTGPLAKPWGSAPAAYPSNTILKPDILAPGVELYGAAPGSTVGNTGGFQQLSGTSMATPHIAGIAALIIQQHPDWTPSQVMSAMQTTARTTSLSGGAIKNEYGAAATPWEAGAGHVVPARAVDPGLTYDAGEQDFKNFLAGQNLNKARGEFGSASLKAVAAKNLNRPAISLPKVNKKAKVTRTVTNVADTTSTYTVKIKKPAGVNVKVSPSRFTIAPGQRKTFTVTVVVKWASSSFKFGSLTWVDDQGHSVRSVLAVQPTTACWFGC